MARFLLGEAEELIRSFRPHVLSYMASYAAGLLWLAWGTAAFLLESVFTTPLLLVGLLTTMMLTAVHGWMRSRVTGDRRVAFYNGAAAAVFIAAGVSEGAGLLPPSVPYGSSFFVAGAGLSAVSVGLREANRLAERTYLTNRRVVIRRGLAPRQEHVVTLHAVQDVKASQGIGGTIFGYGRISLIRGVRDEPNTKGGTRRVADAVILRGVPRFERTKRVVLDLYEDVKLPDNERRRRIEDRRLRDAMRILEAWSPPEDIRP